MRNDDSDFRQFEYSLPMLIANACKPAQKVIVAQSTSKRKNQKGSTTVSPVELLNTHRGTLLEVTPSQKCIRGEPRASVRFEG